MKRRDTKTLATEWFESGENNLGYARLGLAESEYYPEACVLCQQAGERYLKGFLVLNNKEPERTHDLTRLLDECIRIEPKFEEIRDECELLTGFYTEARYPPEIPEYSKDEAEEALRAAEKIVNFIGELIS